MQSPHLYTPQRLAVAFAKVRANRGMPGVDGVSVECFGLRERWELDHLANDVERGSYRPGALRRVELCLPGKSPRTLAIPTVRDRVLQTAVAQHLAPACEARFYDASHGYRPLRSIYTALAGVSDLLAGGRGWVIDGDIRRFFDSIPHHRLLDRLCGWVDDPLTFALISRWLESGACTPGAGVAQGSPLSPVLSNIYLHEFDQRLADANVPHVRYADDFVALLSGQAEAYKAHALCGHALADLGLQLHPEKTRIVHLDDGFIFLGARFGATQIAWQSEFLTPVVHSLTVAAPSLSQPIDALHEEPQPNSMPQLEPPPAPPAHQAHSGALRSLYLVEQGTFTRRDGERFTVSRGNDEMGSFHAASVDVLIAFGNAAISMPAMRLALEHGIPIVLAGVNGRFHGIVDSHDDKSVALHADQFRVAGNAAATLELARAFVLGKLNNGITLLQRQWASACPTIAPHLAAMRQMRAAARGTLSLEALRGCEGFAAKSFYAALGEITGPCWGFEGRNRRPPRDGVNAMLSFGYSLLSHNVYALVKARGLNAHVGYLHPSRPGHPALVSDLIEEFRSPVVDQLVLTSVAEGRMAPGDFTVDAEQGCIMSVAARRRFIAAFEDAMGGRGNTASGPIAGGFRSVIHAQTRHLSDFFRSKKDTYDPFRLGANDTSTNPEVA